MTLESQTELQNKLRGLFLQNAGNRNEAEILRVIQDYTCRVAQESGRLVEGVTENRVVSDLFNKYSFASFSEGFRPNGLYERIMFALGFVPAHKITSWHHNFSKDLMIKLRDL